MVENKVFIPVMPIYSFLSVQLFQLSIFPQQQF